MSFLKRLSPSDKSIFFFAFWVLGCAIGLLGFPSLMFQILGVTPAETITPRMFGLVLVFLSYYYIRASLRGDMKAFYRFTVHTRLSVLPLTALLALFSVVPWAVAGFCAMDFVGAVWTFLALRHEAKS